VVRQQTHIIQHTRTFPFPYTHYPTYTHFPFPLHTLSNTHALSLSLTQIIRHTRTFPIDTHCPLLHPLTSFAHRTHYLLYFSIIPSFTQSPASLPLHPYPFPQSPLTPSYSSPSLSLVPSCSLLTLHFCAPLPSLPPPLLPPSPFLTSSSPLLSSLPRPLVP
jgi:hypothetical protein